MQERRFLVNPLVLRLLLAAGSGIVLIRMIDAVLRLKAGEPDRFLAAPLAMALPLLCLGILARLPGAKSSEGALMRLAAMIMLALMLAAPPVALHLALGTPIAFLCVELFVTRAPPGLRRRIEGWTIA